MQGAFNYGASVICHIFPRECNRHARLIHRILDEPTIYGGQHFPGYSLGCRQEARAKPGNRKHPLSDFLSFKWQSWAPGNG
jgi:hypothetical protein